MAPWFYRALESVSMIASALSTALTIYPCQIRSVCIPQHSHLSRHVVKWSEVLLMSLFFLVFLRCRLYSTVLKRWRHSFSISSNTLFHNVYCQFWQHFSSFSKIVKKEWQREWKNACHLTFVHNFVRCWSGYVTARLSSKFAANFVFSFRIMNMLLHYHVKFNPLIVIVAIWDGYILMLSPEHQSAQMSKIINDGLTWSGTGCFVAVPVWQQWVSKG